MASEVLEKSMATPEKPPFFSPGLFLGGACSLTALAVVVIKSRRESLGACARAPRTLSFHPLLCPLKTLCCKQRTISIFGFCSSPESSLA